MSKTTLTVFTALVLAFLLACLFVGCGSMLLDVSDAMHWR